MNDRRFIELLNLYLDHEISPAESAELEAEVARNPARRREYDRYCRLQRGCSLLGERERSVAPQSAAFVRSLREAERKIAAPRRAAWNPAHVGLWTASAMAACVAVVVVVNRSPSGGRQADPVVAAKVDAPAAPEVSATVATVARATPVAAFELHPALAASGLGVARNPREAEIAATDREALEWMQRVDALQSRHLIVDELAFDSPPVLQQENRVFRSRHPIQGGAEFTAFQFQR